MKKLKEKPRNCLESSRRILPPPPDVRVVIGSPMIPDQHEERERTTEIPDQQEERDLTAPSDDVSSTPKMLRNIEQRIKAR